MERRFAGIATFDLPEGEYPKVEGRAVVAGDHPEGGRMPLKSPRTLQQMIQ